MRTAFNLVCLFCPLHVELIASQSVRVIRPDFLISAQVEALNDFLKFNPAGKELLSHLVLCQLIAHLTLSRQYQYLHLAHQSYS